MSERRLLIHLFPVVFAIFGVIWLSPATADDWPQWQGTNRNSISSEKGLLTEWPEDGPVLTWKLTDIGGGYSAPAISNGHIFGMSNRGDDEVVWALAEKDGSEVWATKIGPAEEQGGRQGKEGPDCTPTVDGDRLYVVGAGGTVACLQVSDGKVVWQRSMTADFGGKLPTWRYSESPLVDGDKVICTPGGTTATMLALHKNTGETIWKTAPLTAAESPQENESEQPAAASSTPDEKPTVVLAAGSKWKYLDTGKAPGVDWTKPEFDDGSWHEGAAQLGYGDGDEKTRLNKDADNYPTYYFRKSFDVRNAGQLKPLVLRLLKDDGAIVYLNGKEICRDNMPDGAVDRETFAEQTTEVEDDFYLHDVKAELASGENVIAVEVHQASATSSDVSFDLEIREKTASDRLGAPARRRRSRRRGGGSGAGYSSPIAIDFEGQRQYVQLTATALIGVDASTGEILWSYKRPANAMRINCSTPIYHDGMVFAASAYGNGGGAVKLTKLASGEIEAEEVYFTSKMQNHHGGMIVHDGCLYGANGGNGGGFLACLDFETGDVFWRDRKAPKGALAMAGDRIYLYTEDGTVMLIEPNREKLIERGRFKHPDRSQSPAWTHPVIANGKLYIRDQNVLMSYNVRAEKD